MVSLIILNLKHKMEVASRFQISLPDEDVSFYQSHIHTHAHTSKFSPRNGHTHQRHTHTQPHTHPPILIQIQSCKICSAGISPIQLPHSLPISYFTDLTEIQNPSFLNRSGLWKEVYIYSEVDGCIHGKPVKYRHVMM